VDQQAFYKELTALQNKFERMEPELEVTVRDPDLDVEGYIVVWNTGVSVGSELERCGKGGTRITPNLKQAEVKMLAHRMALKNAASGLPFGGSKAGLKADPDAPDFEEKYRRFVSLCKPFLFENGGIFGGFGFDIGARPIHPIWACDELASTRCFTGKPVNMGGTDYDKEGIAGLGVAVSAKTALECDGLSAQGACFAVQGIGAMGAAVIRYFSEFGGKLFAVADLRLNGTWIFGPEGAPQDLVESLIVGDIQTAKTLIAAGDFQNIPEAQEVLYQDIDVIFPCAIQDVITVDNVTKIKAKYVTEGANNPTSDAARTELFERGITVLPDFIANPGGVIAAYVEMTSKTTPAENEKTRINVKNAKKMTRLRIAENTKNILKMARDLHVEPSHAGQFIALKNIFKTGCQIKQDMKIA